MLSKNLKIVKVVKEIDSETRTFYNIYLFGVLIKALNKNDASKLYFLVRGYLNSDEETSEE